MPDNHSNFGYSLVLTAPTPAASGTSLVLAAGGGALMPTAPWNGTVWPTATGPLLSNAEIVRVTAVVGDTLTIVRAQEGTAARAIVAGDQFANTITVKVITDIEAEVALKTTAAAALAAAAGIKLDDFAAPDDNTDRDATTSLHGLMPKADKVKLDAIESGATADQTNAEIETAYNAQVAIVAQAEAETGTATTVRRWTAQRIGQAIAALAAGGGAVSSIFGRAGAVVAVAGDYLANLITFTPAGNIAATDVQAAIEELDTEKQPVDSDLTAIAALTTTAYGRAFLALADAAAGRTALGLGTAATTAASAYEVAGAAAAAQAASQPVDSDLTAIAALTTTAFGRAFLALADAAAARTAVELNNVTNDAQTKAAIVPNTVPAAGQFLVGNAGGTAYAPVSASGDATIGSTGAVAVTKVAGIAISGTPSVGQVPVATSTSAATWQTPGTADLAAATVAAAGKTTPVDADLIPLVDSEASNVLKKLTWANLKATAKAYFDTLYPASRTGVVREVWIGAGAMTPSAVNGAATGSYAPAGADAATIDVFDFDDTTSESVQFTIAMPSTWNLGTVKVKAYWTTISGTGTVIWSVAAGAASDDDALGAILGTAVTVTDTRLADADLHISPATAAITVGGTPVLDDLVLFKIARDISDTKTGDARLLGIKLQYTESATEPTAW